MQGKTQRLVELDFFRGLVLLIIVVDHIGGSILSRFTLHAFALNDAAEVFVFLGGYATATAYAALAARRSESAARTRFVRRAFEIYRSFLVTAALMLVVSFLLKPFFGTAPNLALHDLDSLLSAPAASIGEILLMKRQPYLAAVLPMYAFFALAAPFILPAAQKRPWQLLLASILLWAVAPQIGEYLPSVEDNLWDFNPAAWQLMFVLGVIARCQPVYQRVAAHRFGRAASAAALAIVAGMAYYKLALLPAGIDSDLKRDLAAERIVNFLAIAWIAADFARAGLVRKVALRFPAIQEVGRAGMFAFVAGAVISLVVDSVLFTLTDNTLDVRLGIAADIVAISALIVVPRLRKPFMQALAFRSADDPRLRQAASRARGTH
jgi:hypothetical protein